MVWSAKKIFVAHCCRKWIRNNNWKHFFHSVCWPFEKSIFRKKNVKKIVAICLCVIGDRLNKNLTEFFHIYDILIVIFRYSVFFTQIDISSVEVHVGLERDIQRVWQWIAKLNDEFAWNRFRFQMHCRKSLVSDSLKTNTLIFNRFGSRYFQKESTDNTCLICIFFSLWKKKTKYKKIV